MNVRNVGVSLTCVLATLALSACGSGPKTRVPSTATTPTRVTSAIIRPAGESIGLSDEIIRLCNMELSDHTSAPKYEFDRTELAPGDRATLGKVAECLTTGALKGKALQLVGRADARGESSYNMALGAQRAGGVAEYLAHLGVERNRLGVTSRGELDAVGTEETGWQVDRRVDITLSK